MESASAVAVHESFSNPLESQIVVTRAAQSFGADGSMHGGRALAIVRRAGVARSGSRK
jgi:hypothetical protein